MAKKGTGKTSKADMVRTAIDKLGWKAPIDEYQAYIKATYGVEMSKPHISQTKSNERRRRGVRGRRRKSGSGAGAAVTAGSAKVADILSFVDTVREWETRIGAAGIREVVKTVLRK